MSASPPTPSLTGAFRRLLDRTPTRGGDTAHTEASFWPTVEVGTLGEDRDAGRAAVLDLARGRTATATEAPQEGSA